MRFLLYLGMRQAANRYFEKSQTLLEQLRHYISIYVYIRLFESNGLVQTSNGVATLVKHFHQNQYQTLSLVNFGDGSVVLLIETRVIKKLTVVLLYSDAFEEWFNCSHSFFLWKKEGNENVGLYLSFFMGSFHTWIFSKYFYATETEDYKNFLRMDSVIYYEI